MTDTVNQLTPPPTNNPPEPPPGIPVASTGAVKPLEGANAPVQPPITSVISPAPPPSKISKKLILGFVVILLFLASIPAAVFLTQQSQEIREKAAEPSDCESHGGFSGWGVDCDCDRMQPYGEKVNVVICNDGTHLPNTPTGERCEQGACGGGGGCQNPTGNNGDWRYECTRNQGSCPADAGVGIPWRCEGSNWVNKNPSGECTRECRVGDGGDWHQCLYTDRDEPPENLPCGSCSVPNVGSGTMNFGCELDCGGSPSRCPGGQAGSYSIAHRWERCSSQGTQSCTPSSSDYIGSGDLGGPGPWTITGQSTVNGSGTFSNPGCGRVQVDVQMPQTGTAPGADVFNTGRDCAGAPQPTPTPTPGEPPPAPLCRQIKAYDTNWNPLNTSQLSHLRPGDKVRLATLGQPAAEFTKARLRVNQGNWQETTTKKPNTDEFYLEYAIPANITNFKIEAEVYHRDQGWK